MAREFKPVRFFVMMVAGALVVCGVTPFYTHRAAHGRTAQERAAYAIGGTAAEGAPAGAKLPTDADLNMMAEKCQAAGAGRTVELGPGLRDRIHGLVQNDA